MAWLMTRPAEVPHNDAPAFRCKVKIDTAAAITHVERLPSVHLALEQKRPLYTIPTATAQESIDRIRCEFFAVNRNQGHEMRKKASEREGGGGLLTSVGGVYGGSAHRARTNLVDVNAVVGHILAGLAQHHG